MMPMKRMAIVLLLGGLVLAAYAGWQIVAIQWAVQESVQAAETMLGEPDLSEKKPQALMTRETFQPKEGEVIGLLVIPRLELRLAIIEGTSAESLKQGVGRHLATVYPGDGDQILLAGHRDTVFGRLGELEPGDKLEVWMPYGRFIYTVFDHEIVDSDDTTVIRSTAPEEWLVLSTCYPFRYVGPAPRRYVLYAK